MIDRNRPGRKEVGWYSPENGDRLRSFTPLFGNNSLFRSPAVFLRVYDQGTRPDPPLLQLPPMKKERVVDQAKKHKKDRRTGKNFVNSHFLFLPKIGVTRPVSAGTDCYNPVQPKASAGISLRWANSLHTPCCMIRISPPASWDPCSNFRSDLATNEG